MEMTLPQPQKATEAFYTKDEQALLYKLEHGLVETVSHEQVMENLRHRLGLGENEI